MLGEPFPRQYLEAVGRPIGHGGFLCLARRAGVDIVGEQLAGRVPTLTRVFQRNVGINPQGQSVFLAVEAVFQPPPLTALGRDFQIEPPTVEDLPGFQAWLGISDRGSCQHRRGNFNSLHAYCPRCCPNFRQDVNERLSILLDNILIYIIDYENKKDVMERLCMSL